MTRLQDPYFGEISAFIDACDPASTTNAVADDDELEILSTFEDSVKTFALLVLLHSSVSHRLTR
jgi:hypothetical protein